MIVDRPFSRPGRPVAALLAVVAAALAPPAARAQVAPCSVFARSVQNLSRPGPDPCPGDRLRYTICLRSQSATAPASVVWGNLLPGACFASFSWVAKPGDSSCSRPPAFPGADGNACTSGFTVPPGGETCAVFEATLGAPLPDDPTACTVDSLVSWDAGGCSSENTQLVSCAPPGTPDVRLTKVIEGVDPAANRDCSTEQVTEGTTVVFRVVARNRSSDTAERAVVVTDELPAELRALAMLEPACAPCDAGCPVCYDPAPPPNGLLTWSVGDLAPLAEATLRFALDVPRTCGPPGSWSFANQARVTSAWIAANVPGGSRLSDNLDQDRFPLEPACSGPIARTGAAAATVTKSADRAEAAPGERVRFTIAIDATASDCDVTGSLRDDSPAGLRVDDQAPVVAPPGARVDAQGPPQGANGAGYVDVQDLLVPAGTRATVEYEVTLDPALTCAQHPEANRAVYALSTGGGVAAAPRLSVTNPAGDRIAVVKDVDRAAAVPGDLLTYTVRIRNLGACPVVAGRLVDVLPAALALVPGSVTVTGPGGVDRSTATAVEVAEIEVRTVAPEDELVVRYQARVQPGASGDVTNTASVEFPGAAGSDTATTSVTAPQCPAPPPPIPDVRAAKLGDAVRLAWSATPEAASWNVWKVVSGEESLIPQANAATVAMGDPRVVAASCSPTALPECTDAGAVTAPPPLVFYQVRGVCANGVEGDAHPF